MATCPQEASPRRRRSTLLTERASGGSRERRKERPRDQRSAKASILSQRRLSIPAIVGPWPPPEPTPARCRERLPEQRAHPHAASRLRDSPDAPLPRPRPPRAPRAGPGRPPPARREPRPPPAARGPPALGATAEAPAADRLFWIALSRSCTGWRAALAIVSPATVVAWQQRGAGSSTCPRRASRRCWRSTLDSPPPSHS